MNRRMTVNDEFEWIVKEGVLVLHTGCTVQNLHEAIEENHEISSGSDLNLVRDV